LDTAEDLGDHQGRADALDEAGEDQRERRGGDAASERGEREQAQPAEEDAPVAAQVAQAGAGDQQHGIGQDVAGDHEL